MEAAKTTSGEGNGAWTGGSGRARLCAHLEKMVYIFIHILLFDISLSK
jgi:hypothetical protein